MKIPFLRRDGDQPESETPVSEYDPHGKGFDPDATEPRGLQYTNPDGSVHEIDEQSAEDGMARVVSGPTKLPGEPGGPADLPDAGYAAERYIDPEGGPNNIDHPRYGKNFDRSELIDPADPQPISPSTSSSRIMFDDIPDPEPERDRCPVCRGTGWKMTTSDFLRESIGLIEGQEDSVVREFYRRLLDVAPHLAALFPADLLTTDETRHQRDKLVGALAALATHYDPTNPNQMETLKTALAAMGRAHSAFRRPDGTVSPASLDEYQAVKVVLFGTLHDMAGAAWLPVYDAAWSEAYDFAASHMMVAAFANPQQFARTVRASR